MESVPPLPVRHGPALFFSDFGLRSGWRVLLWAVVFVFAATVVFFPVRPWMESLHSQPVRLLVAELSTAAVALFATFVLARWIDRQPVAAYGWAPSGALRRFGIGLVSGFCSLTLLLGILWLAGAFQVNGLALHGAGVWSYALLWALVFFCVALAEEAISRSYLLFALTQGLGFWPAAILLSALFAAGHIKNPGETVLGITAAGILGLVLAWSVRWTGSLWWALGYHAAWDWAESYFYGVPDSGIIAEGHLLSTTLQGPAWLSGGPAGPEGSIVTFAVVLGLAVLVWRVLPSACPPALHRRKSATLPETDQLAA
jgi:uncharacterized protein